MYSSKHYNTKNSVPPGPAIGAHTVKPIACSSVLYPRHYVVRQRRHCVIATVFCAPLCVRVRSPQVLRDECEDLTDDTAVLAVWFNTINLTFVTASGKISKRKCAETQASTEKHFFVQTENKK